RAVPADGHRLMGFRFRAVRGRLPQFAANLTTSPQSIPNNTSTPLSLAPYVDTDGFWNAGAPTHIVIPKTMHYLVLPSVAYAPNAVGERWARLMAIDPILGPAVL